MGKPAPTAREVGSLQMGKARTHMGSAGGTLAIAIHMKHS
jgi:hypothetical protein